MAGEHDSQQAEAAPPRHRQDTVLAVVTALTGALGIAWIGYLAYREPISGGFAYAHLALAIAGIVAGIGALRGRTWARWLGVVFFAVQIVQIATPALTYVLMLGLNFSVSAGSDDGGWVGLNLFALAMTFWSLWRAARPYRPEEGTAH